MCWSRILLLALGGLSVFSFAPFGAFCLLPVTLGGLFFCWQRGRAWGGLTSLAQMGFFFGLGYFGAGISWVYISLYDYGDAALPVALVLNFLLIVVMALYFALCGWLLARYSRANSALRAAWIPFFWTGAELLRAYFLTGFPWLAIGYSQVQSPLAAFAPLVGVLGMGFVLSGLVSLLVWCAFPPKLIAPQKRFFLPLSIIGAMWLFSWALGQITFVHPVGTRQSIALVQGNVAQLTKFDPTVMEEDLANYLRLARQQTTSVVVLPETALPFLEETLRWDILPALQMGYAGRGQTLITGIFAGNAAREEYFNAVIALGAGQGRYYKRHLLPFGEYIPLRGLIDLFSKFFSIPYSSLTAGEAKQSPFTVNGYRVGVSICFEAAFGRMIRDPRVNYLINVSNDGWFNDSIAAPQHLQMNQMRALELGREMARATNNGITAIIDNHGRVRQRLPRHQRAVLVGEIQPYAGVTPYARWGNAIVGGIWGLYGLILLLVEKLYNRRSFRQKREQKNECVTQIDP